VCPTTEVILIILPDLFFNIFLIANLLIKNVDVKFLKSILQSAYLPDSNKSIYDSGSVVNIDIKEKDILLDISINNPTHHYKNKLEEVIRNSFKDIVEYKLQINFLLKENKNSDTKLESVSKVKNIIAVCSGKGGVGKSTIINKIIGTSIPTNKVSLSHDQGQHTTTFSNLYRLDFGGTIIDTPGIKGFGLVEIDINEIRSFFPEFVKLQSGCKFNNCKHINEPQCNVLYSLSKGLIAKHRYDNYLNMIETEESIYRTNNF